jgi:hypothetical protein
MKFKPRLVNGRTNDDNAACNDLMTMAEREFCRVHKSRDGIVRARAGQAVGRGLGSTSWHPWIACLNLQVASGGVSLSPPWRDWQFA